MEGCKSYCAGGCINGAAHTLVLQGKTIGELEDFCNSPGVDPEVRITCYHGIGHSFIESTNLDIEKTLKLCEQIKLEEGRYQCGHATVMDYGIPASAPLGKIPKNVSAFCSKINPSFRESCFIFTGFLEYARSLDAQNAFEECSDIPSEFREGCIFRLGEAIFSKYREDDPSRISSECQKGTEKDSESCIKAAVVSSLFSTSGAFGGFTEAICGGLEIPKRDECYLTFAEAAGNNYGKSRRDEFCKTIKDSPLKERCYSEEF